MSKINFEKLKENSKHFLSPKIFLRYAPGSMRKEEDGERLNSSKAFSMNRISNTNNFETGVSSAIGFDYKIKQNNLTKFDFSLAQVINEKENKKMADKSSLNEKLSDIVGESSYSLTEKFNLNYNFALDQNINDFNYNEIGMGYNDGPLKIDFNYLSEKKHIGDQDYFKTQISLKNKDKRFVKLFN